MERNLSYWEIKSKTRRASLGLIEKKANVSGVNRNVSLSEDLFKKPIII